ncbi:MAG: hypothetical protein H7A09_05610 [Oceanospirillaceae bacterium]|nr:hypothetical protein [Oceanospirillaceae bacterium]MCP5334086.1 hypothetical protein [Oceanospirillaceae bacterium]MCP5351278.1 hypothetical protein [Oceanospirillaceae bacterium]
MNTKNILSAVLAVAVVSVSGTALAATATAPKPADAISVQCHKEFGKNKMKVEQCIQEKTKAGASQAAPAKPAEAPMTK